MPSGRMLEVRAPTVIVACGTVHTPLLLRRSRLPDDSAQRGRNLALHPATAAFALMDEPVDMARGVPQSFYVDEFAGEGIMFEGVAGPPAYAAMSLPLTGEAHARAMAGYRLCERDLRRFPQGGARRGELFLGAGPRQVPLPLPAGVRPADATARDL